MFPHPGDLLNHRWLGDRRNLLQLLCFLLALLVGGALACGDLVEGAPLRLHRSPLGSAIPVCHRRLLSYS